MSSDAQLGSALATSLVANLAADCSVAAELAAVADMRRGGWLDTASVSWAPRGVIDRVANDFEARGWLIRRGDVWLVPEAVMPRSAPAFLAGMAAMRGPAAAAEAALTAVTLPSLPSAFAAALPGTGLSYASLISTEDAMARVADRAVARLTVISPFLNRGGLTFAMGLFHRSAAMVKTLVVRGSGSTREAMRLEQRKMESLRVTVLDCLLPTEDGYETVHAKVVLADDQLAYVGSANLLAQRFHSIELGNVVRGQAARVVASVVRAVETASSPWDWHQ